MEPWAQSPAPQKRHNPSTGKIETSRIEIQVQSQPLLRRNMSQHGLHGTLSQRKTKEEARIREGRLRQRWRENDNI